MRTSVVTCLVGASLAVALGASPAFAADKPPVDGRSGAPDQRAATADPGTSDAQQAVVQAYLSAYPRLSRAQATEAAAGADARKAVYDRLASTQQNSFGGAWFQPESGVLNIAVTSKAAAGAAAAISAQEGVQVTTHVVRRSFSELERLAGQVRGDRTTALGRQARGQVGIDVQRNEVVAAVPARSAAALRAGGLPGGVDVAVDPGVTTQEDAGCTTRNACDWTVRAGAMLWRGSAGSNACSVGFTGRTSTGTRYVYTAGHCSNGNGVTWGTGGLPIGPMSSSRNSGAVDAALIRVTNSWFTGDLGGEIYHPTATGRSVPVKGVAPTLSYIVAGETVCLSANFSSPGGSNLCGVVGTNSDAAVRGMVRINGLDACPGDSGGGWYWMNSSGNRYAYGIHSRSDVGCHISGGRSWFSAVPTVKNTYAPGVNIEIR